MHEIISHCPCPWRSGPKLSLSLWVGPCSSPWKSKLCSSDF